MTIKSVRYTAEYSCRKKPTPEEHKEIRERLSDSYALTGIDRLRAFYEWQGLEFDECVFDEIIRKCPPDVH
jgi:hypothetical protein